MASTALNISGDDIALNFQPIFTTEKALHRYQQFKDFVKGVLKEGVDFGKVPGTDKDTLLKPGAEKLCTFFGLTPRYVAEVIIEDWSGKGEGNGQALFYYRYKCQLFRGDFQMGEGIGSSSSWESKHRYRWVAEDAAVKLGHNPESLVARGGAISEFEFAINKAETTGQYGKPAEYWDRFKRAIADGKARKINKTKKDGATSPAYEIEAKQYRIPNDQFADIINTVQKIAQKRAYVAATLSATNASDYFTQDVEDYIEIEHVSAGVSQQESGPQGAAEHGFIDIGQNPINTQEAANYVRDQKLLEAQRESPVTETPTWVDKPAQAAKAPGVIPEAVLNMWERMTTIPKRCAVFENLKYELEREAGLDQGTKRYYEILNKHGFKHANEIAKDPMRSRKIAQEMYETLQNYKRPANPNITDEDIPR